MSPLGIGKNVAETMPMALCSLPGQAAGSGLLGMPKQESTTDSQNHTPEIVPGFTVSYMANLAFTHKEKGLYAAWCYGKFRW